MCMRHLAALLVLGVFALAAAAPVVHAARLELPVILVDLAHGEQYNGVCAMMRTVPDAYWIILVKSEDAAQQLPQCIKNMAYKIVVGNLTYLGSGVTVDMVIIGQPVVQLTDAEKEAVTNWFKGSGYKALWCATDSDYPAQGGNLELAQHICNSLLDYMAQHGVPVKLRSDYVSVEDTKSNAGRSYRVIALVEPPARYDAELLALGAQRVLMHGPGAVSWVDSQGNWHKIIDPRTGKQIAPQDIVPILVTTDAGEIVEHQPKAPGEPGEFGRAYQAGEKGKFCLMAAQIIDLNGRKVVIVSGESPYFGYQSMVTYQYHGKLLDGPRFFRNLVLWATGDYNELKAFKQIMEEQNKLAQQAAEQAAKAQQAGQVQQPTVSKQELEQIKSQINEQLQSVQNAVNNAIKSAVKQLESQVENQIKTLDAKASNAYVFAIGALVLAVIAVLAAGLALQRKTS